MKHFVVIFNDKEGRPISVAVIAAPANTQSLNLTNYTFNSADDANAYKAQCEAFYRLPPGETHKATGKRQRVICMQTDKIYRSAAAAAYDFGVTTSAMTLHLRDPSALSHIKGHTFARINSDGKPLTPNGEIFK